MIPPEMARQLEILGYTDKSKVRVRCFIAKGMPIEEQVKRGAAWRKDEKTIIPIPIEGWLYSNGTFVRLKKKRCGDQVELDSNSNPIWIEAETYQNGIGYLRTINAKGYGIYLIPNSGGGADADITRFPALFYECDAINKEEQRQRLQSLESKLERSASMVVETRNSLHCYFKLEYDKLLPSTWSQYQQRLIQEQQSDEAIWNPARLMRLVGFDHQKWNSDTRSLEQFPVQLAWENDSTFSLDEFDEVLPQWDEQRWSQSQRQGERVATNPTDDPWDIRNFASYLDGYRVDGRRGWDTCKCPAHNGESDNSLHIEQNTGAYKCHRGCNPKDIRHAALELARARGYQVSEQRSGHQFADLGGWLFKLKQQLAKTIKRRNVWGFGPLGKVEVEPKLSGATQTAIEYQPGERLNVWKEGKKQGYKYILDTSSTGTGKSYDAGRATTELFGASQLIYASTEHRNPTTSTLSSWDDLESRHKGLVRDPFGKLRRASAGQPYASAPNCGRNDVIGALRSKNISGADTAGLICSTCPQLEPCRAGAVFGFLHERMTTLKQPRFRAHPESLPSPNADYGEPYNYSGVVLIWDEATEIIRPYRSVEVTAADLQRTIAGLEIASPEIFDVLRPMLTVLHPYLSGEIKPPYYGWKDAFIRAVVPQVGVDIDQVRSHLVNDLDEILNSTKEHGVDLAELPRGVRKRFSDSDADLSLAVSKKLSLNWLPDFLDVLLGNSTGNLQIGYDGTLTVTLPDKRLAEIAQAAAGNIFLDATTTAEDLALVLGCKPSEILTVRQKMPDANNLEITQVATMGRLGVRSDRSKFCQSRVDALINQITANTSGEVAVFDFKRHTSDGDGKRRWWTDSRGMNDFIGCDALVLVGVPCRNLAALEAEFSVLYGRSPQDGTGQVKFPIQVNGQPSPDLQPYFEMEVSADVKFREFCHRRILADIHQAIGRLRAHRRSGQQLTVYFIGDYPLDVPVTLKKASDITPDAATKPERVEMAIKGAVKQLRDAGQKITQGAIAAITGYSQQHISRFKPLLISLLENLNSKMSKNDEPPPDVGELQWMGREYLPILAELPPSELLNEVLATFESYEQTVWRQIWDATPGAAQVKILNALMFSLSAGELRSLGTAAGVAV